MMPVRNSISLMQYCTCAIIYYELYYKAVNEKSDGLRERKRLETRQALEKASVDLVSIGGLDQTTIEAISEQAHVSPRTFFNYFDSKEDALLGFRNIELNDDIIETCAESFRGDSTAAAIIGLMVQLIGPSLTDRELYKVRRQLIKKYPQLLERQMSQMAHVGKQLGKAAQRIATLVGNQELSDDEADILLAMCSSSLRVAIREWIKGGQKSSLSNLEYSAIQKLNEVLVKI